MMDTVQFGRLTDDSEQPAFPFFYHKHRDCNLYFIHSS